MASRPPSVTACTEVHESALGVQEYFQAYIREQKWSIANEQVSDDLLTFTMPLTSQQLSIYTERLTDAKVTLFDGKVLTRLRTIELPDGYIRVVAEAEFVGHGESADRFAPKREFWNLQTNGTLETSLLTALSQHLAATH